MRITPELRTAAILRIRERLGKGASLADASAAESLKPTTFIAWMRRLGPDGKGGPGYPRKIIRRALLTGWSECRTFDGMGTSFNATVRTRVFAEFHAERGVDLVVTESSASAWIGDGSRKTEDTIGCALRSFAEIREAARAVDDSEGGLDKIADNARTAFPWLPEKINA